MTLLKESIDTAHSQTHQGNSYETEHEFTGVSAGASVEILIEVGTKTLHFDYFLKSENDGRMEIFEAPTATPGTAKTIYNQNRASSNTSTATITHTPSGVTAGSTVFHRNIFYGSVLTGASTSGRSARAPERILKKNTDYLVRITNNAAGAQDFHIQLGWYEP